MAWMSTRSRSVGRRASTTSSGAWAARRSPPTLPRARSLSRTEAPWTSTASSSPRASGLVASRSLAPLRDVTSCALPPMPSTIRELLTPGARLVVMGAGFIGCEAAATARGLGADVAIVALDEQPMIRPLGPELGAAMRRRHEHHGVHFHLGRTIDAFAGDDGVRSVSLSDGTELPGGRRDRGGRLGHEHRVARGQRTGPVGRGPRRQRDAGVHRPRAGGCRRRRRAAPQCAVRRDRPPHRALERAHGHGPTGRAHVGRPAGRRGARPRPFHGPAGVLVGPVRRPDAVLRHARARRTGSRSSRGTSTAPASSTTTTRPASSASSASTGLPNWPRTATSYWHARPHDPASHPRRRTRTGARARGGTRRPRLARLRRGPRGRDRSVGPAARHAARGPAGGPGDVIADLDLAADVLDASLAQSRPRYLAYIGSSGLEVGAARRPAGRTRTTSTSPSTPAAPLSSSTRPSTGWPHSSASLPQAGSFTSGGTISNITALAAARERALPGSRSSGMVGGLPPCTAPPRRTTRHACGRTARHRTRQRARRSPIDEYRRMSRRRPRRGSSTPIAAGITPIAVVATARHDADRRRRPDRTRSPTSAPTARRLAARRWRLRPAGRAGRRHGTPVRRARAGGLAERRRAQVDVRPEGLQCRARSPQEDLAAAFSHNEAYIPHEDDELNAVDVTLEYSRPLRALKLWLALRVHGAQAFRAAIEENLAQARLLYDLAGAHPRLPDAGASAAAVDHAHPSRRRRLP